MKSLALLLLVLLLVSGGSHNRVQAQPPSPGEDASCDDQFSSVYDDDTTLVVELCSHACTNMTEAFDVNYPYILGPLTIQPYPNLTNVDPVELQNLTGELWVRVHRHRNKMQFYFVMDDNPEPFYPYFAMHLHAGNLVAEEIGGSVLVSLAGQGDIVGCVAPDLENGGFHICSEKCTPGSEARGNCVHPSSLVPPPGVSRQGGGGPGDGGPPPPMPPDDAPPLPGEDGPPMPGDGPPMLPEDGPLPFGDNATCPICNLVLVHAYFCQGGCQGDGRIVGNNSTMPAGPLANLYGDVISDLLPPVEALAPSRFCDLGNPDKSSNAPQGKWITGKHSMEVSGNPNDPTYSPYSIGVPENFDLWCGDELPFLYDYVFAPGAASYVALHGDWNATGFASLLFGDTFAAVSTSEGGVQNCTIFGNDDYPCVDGIPGVLAGISDPPLGYSTMGPTIDETTIGMGDATASPTEDEPEDVRLRHERKLLRR